MILKWTEAAVADLDEIQAWIERERPESARRVAQAILEQVESLATTPFRGRSGRIGGIRELVIGKYPYIIPNRIRGEEIHLLRVLHERRTWPTESSPEPGE